MAEIPVAAEGLRDQASPDCRVPGHSRACVGRRCSLWQPWLRGCSPASEQNAWIGKSSRAFVPRGGEISRSEPAHLSPCARRLPCAGGSSVTANIESGAVPGALVTRTPGSDEFRIDLIESCAGRVRCISPSVPSGNIYWGEYFDNRERAEVHIYASTDRGRTWQVAYTFPGRKHSPCAQHCSRRWGDCLWILTGRRRRRVQGFARVLRSATSWR